MQMSEFNHFYQLATEWIYSSSNHCMLYLTSGRPAEELFPVLTFFWPISEINVLTWLMVLHISSLRFVSAFKKKKNERRGKPNQLINLFRPAKTSYRLEYCHNSVTKRRRSTWFRNDATAYVWLSTVTVPHHSHKFLLWIGLISRRGLWTRTSHSHAAGDI